MWIIIQAIAYDINELIQNATLMQYENKTYDADHDGNFFYHQSPHNVLNHPFLMSLRGN